MPKLLISDVPSIEKLAETACIVITEAVEQREIKKPTAYDAAYALFADPSFRIGLTTSLLQSTTEGLAPVLQLFTETLLAGILIGKEIKDADLDVSELEKIWKKELDNLSSK